MKIPVHKIIAPILLASVICGCSITSNKYAEDKRVSFDNLHPSDFEIVSITSEKHANSNLLEAKVTIKNNSTTITDSLHSDENSILMSYKFLWYDKDWNQVTDDKGTIMPLSSKTGQTIVFSGIAPSPVCENFTLKLKSMEK